MALWNSFSANSPVLGSLKDINYFHFRTELPMAVVWANDEVRIRVAQLAFDEVMEILRVSGLFKYDQLTVLAGDEQIVVQYNDDRYQFEVNLQGEGLTITRRGSSMDRFHRWYVEVAPHFGGLVEKICAAIEEAIRSVTSLQRRMVVQSASYNFRFILYDVKDASGRVLLNSEVLEELVPRCPGPDGSPAGTEHETRSIARLDVSFQKWQQREGRTWIEIYSLEAPSNRDWSSIWATFVMVGRSFEDPASGVRSEFESSAFISDYVTPYIEFLRDRGLNGFLYGLAAGRNFSTAAGSLP